MCILLCVKLLLCSSIPYIYCQLQGGTSALSICAFSYMLHSFGVVIFHRCIVNWRRGPWYMCILLYMKRMQCSGIAYIHGQLGGTSALSICTFCFMLNLFSVVVFHRCMVNLRRGPWYMCNLLYVNLMWCSGIPYIYGQLEGVHLPSVYVHSSICETYAV